MAPVNRRPHARRDEVEIPHLLFVERAVISEPVAVEVDRPGAFRSVVTGFWRGGQFHRVLKIVEARYEHGEAFLRVVTDRGCVDLRRWHRVDARTLRARREWEVCADLDAVESPEHTQ
jgi:hypothetical protein